MRVHLVFEGAGGRIHYSMRMGADCSMLPVSSAGAVMIRGAVRQEPLCADLSW